MAVGKKRIGPGVPALVCTAIKPRSLLLPGCVAGLILLSCLFAGCTSIRGDFEPSVHTGSAPLTVNFRDATTCSSDGRLCGCLPGSYDYNWDFDYHYNDGGNRDIDAQGCEVTHTFTRPGTYLVLLWMPMKRDTIIIVSYDTITVTETPSAPTADFGSDVRTGQAPLAVTFTDLSTGTGPFSYAWDFDNDGTVDSTRKDPSHTYNAAGKYTVSLTVTGPGGLDTETRSGYIDVSERPVPPVADFSSDVQVGNAPLAVRFTDRSTGTGPFTYDWDFNNDGTIESHSRDPMFTYPSAGLYTITLAVTGPGGSDSETKTNHVIVNGGPAAPVVNFTSDVRTGNAPLTVAFTDNSTGTGPFTHYWDFNSDGTVDSPLQDPVFTYTSPGTFTVTHAVTSPGGSDYVIRTDYITVTGEQIVPEFPSLLPPALLVIGLLGIMFVVRRIQNQ
jgi:PKD repeat protein